MRETEWVELVAKTVKPELTVLGQSLDVQAQVKIAYGYEIRAYRNEQEPDTEAIEFATDFIVVEDTDGGWKPRVVVEAKVSGDTTHDAITYSQKAASHTLGLFPGRVTYIIDEEGVVRHVFSSQLGVERHVAEAVEALRGYDRIPKRP